MSNGIKTFDSRVSGVWSAFLRRLELLSRRLNSSDFKRLISAKFELQNYDNAVKVFAKVYVSECSFLKS